VVAKPDPKKQRPNERDRVEPEAIPRSAPMQAVVRVTEDVNFAHFHLACGHLVTVSKHDLRNKSPVQMNCWACSLGQ
jgi:hypothetical protein